MARLLRLTLPVLVTLAVIAQAATPAAAQFGKNKIRYEDFHWEIYHSPHFDVYYYWENDELLQKVVSLAESAYDRLSRELDFQIQEHTPLILYKTHSEFLQNNIILNFIPEGVAAFATPARFRMVMPIDLPDSELYALILHELTHIFQYHILFQGSLGKALTSSPPLWLMEGMASYFAKDETASDKMFLRDAVVNDRIPPITEARIGGFFAYRFGHAAFDFMEERWGKDGVMDFLFEFRNTIGARVGRAVERAFRIEPEDFDVEFRRWLRRRYLPELIATGEPSDFGRPFRTDQTQSQETSPAASPSGDLVASFSTHRGDLDIVLFDAKRRRLLRNITKGYTAEYQFLVAQHLTAGRQMGRDLAFSSDGNTVAAFARKESGRSLVLVDVLKGGIDRVIDMDVEQQYAPAFSPDGRTLAFSGNRDGRFDIFLLDLETLEIRNLTNDDLYDGAPSFSPDGRFVVFSSFIGEHAQLFRVDLDDPQVRFAIGGGEHNDMEPVYSPDGKRIYFTSDRTGSENIFGINLESGEVRQYTNAVTGCFMPTVLAQPDGGEQLVYTGYWKGRFDLYETEVDEPIGEPEVASLEAAQMAADLPRFEPEIQVSLDDSNKDTHKGFKLFLEDASSGLGFDDDQTFIGQVILQFSDFLGDKRLITAFQSIESFSNFDVIYTDLSSRLQWSVHLFDDRDFFLARDSDDFFRIRRGRTAFRQTGALASISYPFSFYRRAEVGLGYIIRDIDFQSFAQVLNPESIPEEVRDQFIFTADGRAFRPVIEPRKDDFPVIQAALVGDTTVNAPWGAVSGHRYRIGASYAPDLDESGTLTSTLSLDARQYVPLTRRSNLAFRLFAATSDGNFAQPFYFGGLDTVRGFDFRELVGDRTFFGNIEIRFPLIDLFATPFLNFQGIRGRIFLDIAGVWFNDVQDFEFWDSENSRLQDGVAAYGWGFTVRLFGLNVNWDFSKQWDFESSGDFRTSFWIGQRF